MKAFPERLPLVKGAGFPLLFGFFMPFKNAQRPWARDCNDRFLCLCKIFLAYFFMLCYDFFTTFIATLFRVMEVHRTCEVTATPLALAREGAHLSEAFVSSNKAVNRLFSAHVRTNMGFLFVLFQDMFLSVSVKGCFK